MGVFVIGVEQRRSQHAVWCCTGPACSSLSELGGTRVGSSAHVYMWDHMSLALSMNKNGVESGSAAAPSNLVCVSDHLART